MKRKHSQDLRTLIEETGFLENLSVTMRIIIKTRFLDSSPDYKQKYGFIPIFYEAA